MIDSQKWNDSGESGESGAASEQAFVMQFKADPLGFVQAVYPSRALTRLGQHLQNPATPVHRGFMSGQSGNPSGRPKKRLTECYEALIEQPLPEHLRAGLKLPEGAIWGDAITMGQARAAIKGRTDAAREIADRLEGKARQPVEVSGGTIGYAEIVASIRRRKAQLAEERGREEANGGKTEP